jgi:hypothetical protein
MSSIPRDALNTSASKPGVIGEHPFGADVEDLDHARSVCRDAREVGAVEDGPLQCACLEERFLRPLSRRVVGADEQIADDALRLVAQRGDRDDGGQSAAVLAEVGQLVDVLDRPRRLEDERLEAGRDGRAELLAQRLRACDDLFRVGDVGGRVLIHEIRRREAEHPLGADVEDLDHSRGVRRDAREVRAVEDRALERARAQQRRDVPHLRTRDDRIGLSAPQGRHRNHRGEMLDRDRTARWSRSACRRCGSATEEGGSPRGARRRASTPCKMCSDLVPSAMQQRGAQVGRRTNVRESEAGLRANAGPTSSLFCGLESIFVALRDVHQRSTGAVLFLLHSIIGASGDALMWACRDFVVR